MYMELIELVDVNFEFYFELKRNKFFKIKLLVKKWILFLFI